MRLLFLTSAMPEIGHSNAIRTVTAALLQTAAGLGHQVAWASAVVGNPQSEATMTRLAEQGIEHIADFSGEIEGVPQRAWAARLLVLRNCFRRFGIDLPRLRNPEQVAERLLSWSPDLVILVWDTIFDQVLPFLSAPSIGYWALPTYASAFSALDTGRSEVRRKWVRELVRRGLRNRKERHLALAHHAGHLANICLAHTEEYRAAGIPCCYIPNTWPDPLGADWGRRRSEAEDATGRFQILGSMGRATASGTSQGIVYLASEILPRLESRMAAEPWSISICGGQTDRLPSKTRSMLNHPRIVIKGFVPDIEEEILSSQLFLICNNAGPLVGGYTRVIFAFSTGACVVGHQKLSEAMPEVVHRENALLGSTPDEIADLVCLARRDEELRRRLGANARLTYERHFHPRVVVNALLELGQGNAPLDPCRRMES